MTTLTDHVRKFKMTAKAARGKLRRAGIRKPKQGWQWAKVPAAVDKALAA